MSPPSPPSSNLKLSLVSLRSNPNSSAHHLKMTVSEEKSRQFLSLSLMHESLRKYQSMSPIPLSQVLSQCLSSTPCTQIQVYFIEKRELFSFQNGKEGDRVRLPIAAISEEHLETILQCGNQRVDNDGTPPSENHSASSVVAILRILPEGFNEALCLVMYEEGIKDVRASQRQNSGVLDHWELRAPSREGNTERNGVTLVVDQLLPDESENQNILSVSSHDRIQQLERIVQTIMDQNTEIIATNRYLVEENQRLTERLEGVKEKRRGEHHSARSEGQVGVHPSGFSSSSSSQRLDGGGNGSFRASQPHSETSSSLSSAKHSPKASPKRSPGRKPRINVPLAIHATSSNGTVFPINLRKSRKRPKIQLEGPTPTTMQPPSVSINISHSEDEKSPSRKSFPESVIPTNRPPSRSSPKPQHSQSPSHVYLKKPQALMRRRSPGAQTPSPSQSRPATREHSSSKGRSPSKRKTRRSPSPDKATRKNRVFQQHFSPKASPFPIVKPSKSRATSAGATRGTSSMSRIRPRTSGGIPRVARATTPVERLRHHSPQMDAHQIDSPVPPLPKFSPITPQQPPQLNSATSQPYHDTPSSRRRASETHSFLDSTHHMIPFANSPSGDSPNAQQDPLLSEPQHAFSIMSTDEIQYILLFLSVPEVVHMSELSWQFFDIVNDNRLWKRLFFMYFVSKRYPFHKKWKKEFYVYSKFLQWHPSDHSEYVEFVHKKHGIMATFPSTKYRLEDSLPYVARLKSPVPAQGIFEIEFLRGSVYHNTGVGIATLELMHHAFAWNNRPFNICKDGHELHHGNKDDIDFLPLHELGNIWGNNNNSLGSYVTIQNPPKKDRQSKVPLLPHTSYLNMFNIGLFSNYILCMGIKVETGIRIKKGDSIIIRIDNHTHASKVRSGCLMLSKGGVGSLAFYVNRRQVGIQFVNIFQKTRELRPVFVVANVGDGGLLLQNANHVLKSQ
uniref:F-box domain-containing protein n=1 Tax=Percolomonas cosmopolitus TaxID=63605 RepID=A0A7S1KUA5_9EUKA|mmetsp:Transcript_8761/g.32390  ORF Transcript_8761/g.32390 Transcript_8761/m.32390 type:complete len:959 (+) Transcript_8761:1-2877(+)